MAGDGLGGVSSAVGAVRLASLCASANVAKTLVALPCEKNQKLEDSQVRRHEEDSAGRLRPHPAKSSGLQEYQANLARRRFHLLHVACACIGSYRRGLAGTLPTFCTGPLQLAAENRTAVWRLRRHTALQYSIFSHSRAVLRLNSMDSPQTLHTFTAELRRFKPRTLLLDSDIGRCPFSNPYTLVFNPMVI
jgi:hypothetical protein